MEAIATAKSADFEKLQALLTREHTTDISTIMRLAKEQKILGIWSALRHMSFHTANIALTQGYKQSLRHLGHALNLHDGPLSLFLTTNFADTYSPITLTLINGAGEPLGRRSVNLLADVPVMGTLQDMHKNLAKHPMLQAELFLLLDALVHEHLLCTHAFLGSRNYCRGIPHLHHDAA